MRLEFIVVGFIIVLVVLLVAIALLSGVLPNVDIVFNLFGQKTG